MYELQPEEIWNTIWNTFDRKSRYSCKRHNSSDTLATPAST